MDNQPKRYVEIDTHGVYRVVGHPRMMIDGIIHAFQEGDSPEAIITQWPFLSLEEIYGCITFYLANKQEVENYLARQDALFDKLKAVADANPSPVVLRLQKLKQERAASKLAGIPR